MNQGIIPWEHLLTLLPNKGWTIKVMLFLLLVEPDLLPYEMLTVLNAHLSSTHRRALKKES